MRDSNKPSDSEASIGERGLSIVGRGAGVMRRAMRSAMKVASRYQITNSGPQSATIG